MNFYVYKHKFLNQHWKLENVLKTQELFKLPNKKFTARLILLLTYTKYGIE